MNPKKIVNFLTVGYAGFYPFLLISAANMNRVCLLSTLDLCGHFSLGHMIYHAKTGLDTV